jgi:hypothetical protein
VITPKDLQEQEEFSEEDFVTFMITSPKRKRDDSDGGDATEARLDTTAKSLFITPPT